MKTCIKCGVELRKGDNWKNSGEKSSSYICKKCTAGYTKKYYKKNRKRMSEYSKKYRLEHLEKYRKLEVDWHRRRKIRTLKKYSPELKCKKCGFSDIRALSIDHIDGGGNSHRKILQTNAFYNWLKKNNYPDGFQVLCMNCQFIKRHENKEWGKRFKNQA